MKLATIFAIVLVSFTLPTMAQVDDSLMSDDYITQQEFVEVKVVRVRTIARTITVRGEKKGKTRTFNVPPGTRVSVNGRLARLSDIRPGDALMLAVKQQASEVVVTSIQAPQVTTTLEQRRANPVVEEAAPVMLPKTASQLPLVLVIGMLALFGAGLMRLRRS